MLSRMRIWLYTETEKWRPARGPVRIHLHKMRGREGRVPLKPSELEQRWANCAMKGQWVNVSDSGALACLSPQLSSVFAAQKRAIGTSLAVQWLGLRTSTAGGTGSIPGRGTKTPQATGHSWLSSDLECVSYLPFIWHFLHVCFRQKASPFVSQIAEYITAKISISLKCTILHQRGYLLLVQKVPEKVLLYSTLLVLIWPISFLTLWSLILSLLELCKWPVRRCKYS